MPLRRADLLPTPAARAHPAAAPRRSPSRAQAGADDRGGRGLGGGMTLDLALLPTNPSYLAGCGRGRDATCGSFPEPMRIVGPAVANDYDAGVIFFPPLTRTWRTPCPTSCSTSSRRGWRSSRGHRRRWGDRARVRLRGGGAGVHGRRPRSTLEGLTPARIDELKQGAGRAAEVHNAETNAGVVLGLVAAGPAAPPRAAATAPRGTPGDRPPLSARALRGQQPLGRDREVPPPAGPRRVRGHHRGVRPAARRRGARRHRTTDLMALPWLRPARAGSAPLARAQRRPGRRAAAGARPPAGSPRRRAGRLPPLWAPMAYRAAAGCASARRLRDHELPERVDPLHRHGAPAARHRVVADFRDGWIFEPYRPRYRRAPARAGRGSSGWSCAAPTR